MITWGQLVAYAAPIVAAIGALFVTHDRLARATERIAAMEASAQRQGERLGSHETRIAVLEDRLEQTQPGVQRRRTRGVPVVE